MSNYDWKEIGPQMVGNWPNAILEINGLNLRDYHPKKHYPCPICGGSDRFRFDDRKPRSLRADGSGGYFCNQCGGGDGMSLLQKLTGMNFSETVNALGRFLGGQPVEKRQAAVEQIHSEPMCPYGREVSEEEAAAKMAEARPYPSCPITLVEGIGPDSVRLLWRKGDTDGLPYTDTFAWANPVNHINPDGTRGRLCNVAMLLFSGKLGFLAGGISYNAATVIDGNSRVVLCTDIIDGWHVHHQTGATVYIAYNAQNVDHLAFMLQEKEPVILTRGDDYDLLCYAEERGAPVWCMVGKVVVSKTTAKKLLDSKEWH